MSNYEQSKLEETMYLENTIRFIKKELEKDKAALSGRRSNLIASRKEMWEKAPRSAHDFDKIPEMNHYLAEVTYQTQNYERISNRIKKYKKMIDAPYFARFDFKEDGYDDVEKIYIGLSNLMDINTASIFVYDWRSPIASMYYQCELGEGSYYSPDGMIKGDISLKRQYKIKNSKLNYFFDSSLKINDEILQQVLSRNTSPKMRHIVETIQKEQDLIIRDTESELLIVQGVAGSGKTSIALHRIAFLLYNSMDSNIASNDIIIISPNSIFSNYISRVLPELGEENVGQITYDEIATDIIGSELILESRNQLLESLILLHKNHDLTSRLKCIEFKGSLTFKRILDQLITHYERRLINFEDIYYNGQIIITKQQLKNQIQNDKTGLPLAKRLKRLERIILQRIKALKDQRLKKIQKIVEGNGHYIYFKELKKYKEHIQNLTTIDYIHLYSLLFQKDKLPLNIKKLLPAENKEFGNGYISFEDSIGILYMILKLEGSHNFSNIRQIVIDEAQDYYPLQYEIFKLIFGNARFTILGDVNQSLEKYTDPSIYDDIIDILYKEKSIKLSLNKSYRSSYEISSFSQQILGHQNKSLVPFSRHDTKPQIICKDSYDTLHTIMIEDIISYYDEGYESISIICKTNKESQMLYNTLINITDIEFQVMGDHEVQKGVLIVPAYMAKGLEFDAVLVYDVSKDNYYSQLDRKLIYIACTRALHKLSLYYVGEKSLFL